MPQCDFINLEDAVLCISCAEQLPSENPPSRRFRMAASPVSEQKACTYCTYLNPPERKICEMCCKTLHDTATNVLSNDSEGSYDIISCRACTFINQASNEQCAMCLQPLKIDDVSNFEHNETEDIKIPADNNDPPQSQNIQTPLKTDVNNTEPNALSDEELKTSGVQSLTDNACPVRPNTLSNQHVETPGARSLTENACPVPSKQHIPKNEGMAIKSQTKETDCTKNDRDHSVKQLYQTHRIKGQETEVIGGKDLHMLSKKGKSFNEGFEEFRDEEIEESKRITQTAKTKPKVRHATGQRKGIQNPGPTQQTGKSEKLISSQIQEACEDEDGYCDNHERKTVSCPRCERQCQNVYEEDRKLTCKECQTSFCAGCRAEYSKSCNTNVSCELGSHCHHPRNCIYHLRRMSVKSLQRLLNEQSETFDNKPTWLCEKMRRGRDVKTMQADHNMYTTDIFCDPYKEYLINKINERKLDPACVMTEEELETAFTLQTLGLPKDRAINSLRQFLMEECPLRPLR